MSICVVQSSLRHLGRRPWGPEAHFTGLTMDDEAFGSERRQLPTSSTSSIKRGGSDNEGTGRSGCRWVVHVDQAAEHVVASDLKRRDRDFSRAGGHTEIDAAVRPLLVVMDGVMAQHPREMAVAGDEHPIEALGGRRPHPALRVRVGSR